MLRGPMTEGRTQRVSPRKLAAGHHKPLSRTLCAAASLATLGAVIDFSASKAQLTPGLAAAFAAAGRSDGQLADVLSALRASAQALVWIAAPWLVAVVVATLLVGFAQRVATRSPQGGGARRGSFDVAARASQLLSPERGLDALVLAAMLIALSTVTWLTIAPNVRGLLALPSAEPTVAIHTLMALLSTLAWRLVLTGLVLGALDYLQRRVRHALSMRMTRRELLEEQREQYGDPYMRAERLRRMRSSTFPKAHT